jgi:nitrogen fixation protein FixH
VRSWTWPAIVIGILTVTVLGNLWVMRIARSDPSFAIEENYYQRAVNFDVQRGVEQRSDRLGWTLELSAGPASSAGSALLATLRDADGALVDSAAVTVRLTRVARAHTVIPVPLAPVTGGYGALVPFDAPGLWDVALEARRGTARFVTEQRLDVAAGPGA